MKAEELELVYSTMGCKQQHITYLEQLLCDLKEANQVKRQRIEEQRKLIEKLKHEKLPTQIKS